MSKEFFKYEGGKLPLPVFFPDATRGVIKSIDTSDLESTNTPGILVNTYHLYKDLGKATIEKVGGIRKFMDFRGAVISDSGGFQINTLGSKVTDLLTPEKSIDFQVALGTDMIVVLDDFTPPDATHEQARKTVDNTIEWAKRSKAEFEKLTKGRKEKPYILGVVQGGEFMDQREECTKRLVEIGFDGLGWGGWPFVNGKLNYKSAEVIADNAPKDYFLYGLGVGKPEDVVTLARLGYTIFDCVLPTRDARHRRLYVYNFDSIDKINLKEKNFYSFVNPDRKSYLEDNSPVSTACDCLTCRRYSKAYLTHLFRIGDFTAGRLATIHNLRFYSILMEKIRETLDK